MRFHPTITYEQYRDTCLAVAAAKPQVKPKRSLKWCVGLALVCLALGLSPQIPAARIPGLTVLVILALLWIFSKRISRRSQENCFRAIYLEEKESLNSQIMSIDESGISCDLANGLASSRHTWTAFIKRIDLPDAFVFLPSPNSFVRVPKEALPLSDAALVWQWSSEVPTAGGDR